MKFLAVLLAAAALAAGPSAGAAAWVTGYYASYSEGSAGMAPDQLDYASLTHVIHWPVVPRADGTLVDPATYGLTAAQSALLIARARAAGTKALLGFGGDAASVGDGWRGATQAANRARLIANMVDLMRSRGYDGIDLNWEELAPADEPQFLAFVAELRTALDAFQPRPLLTWVPTTGYQPPVAATAAAMQHFDQINLQTYVMSGPYPGWVTWFNSPLHNGGATFPSTGGALPSADAEVARYRAAGIPAARLGIGIQFDGFVWSGGSGTPTGGVAAPRQDFADDAAPPGLAVLRYADVLDQYGAAPGCRRQFDAIARVPWIGCDRVNDADDRFISFDDEQAIREKARYVAEQGLGGIFVFELSGDFRPGATGDARHPLLAALKAALRLPAAPAGLLGLVNGSDVALSWRNTAGGGVPTALQLEVSGTLQTTLTLPVSESFRYAGVPPGTYGVLLRAVNEAGSSPPSNAVTLRFPGPCSGAPAAPIDLQLTKSGPVLTGNWLPPALGPAVTGYTVQVSGAYVGNIATTERTLAGAVAPGSYTVSVSASNPCGAGPATPAQTITMP